MEEYLNDQNEILNDEKRKTLNSPEKLEICREECREELEMEKSSKNLEDFKCR